MLLAAPEALFALLVLACLFFQEVPIFRGRPRPSWTRPGSSWKRPETGLPSYRLCRPRPSRHVWTRFFLPSAVVEERPACEPARELSRGLQRMAAKEAHAFELEYMCGPPGEDPMDPLAHRADPDSGEALAGGRTLGCHQEGAQGDRRRTMGPTERRAASTAGPSTVEGQSRLECRDFDSSQRVEERIAHLIYHDGITGLPNQALLRDRLDLAVLQARWSGRQLGLLFLDLDRFKES